MIQAEIGAYYRKLGEQSRLAAGAGKLEFLRTWDVMTRTLPDPPASILDIGGATGVYADPLSQAGYRVHVVDPVPEHAAIAAEIPGVTASVGDARALEFDDASVDAALMLGPLYHLPERSDRVQAWTEAGRVVRSGGIVIGATISRFASFLDGLGGGSSRDPEFRAITDTDLATGQHVNPDAVPGWFTTAYFQHHDEIPAEVAAAGLSLERIVPVETAVGFARGQLPELIENPDVQPWMLDVMRRIEGEPGLLGASPHLLTIARRPVSL